jgi:radical S-adenosyl methionine domain-containing protein 2
MPVEGQNDAHIANLTPESWQFDSFVSQYESSRFSGIRIVPEPISTIRGSYVMVDPQGRFFDSTTGSHFYSQAILRAGISCALNQVNFDPEKFNLRNGSADWKTSPDIPVFDERPGR